MVGHFLRLKVALILAGFRTGNIPRTIGTIFGLLLGLVIGVAGLIGGILLGFVPEPWSTIVLHLGLALILLVWLLGPLVIAGSDATMDPVKFTLLPLTKRQLASGLGVAALVGPGGVATLLTMIGIAIGTGRANAGAVLVVLGLAMFTLMCTIASRLLTSLVGLGLRKRGTRDVLAVAIPLTVILLSQLPNIISQVAAAQGPEQTEQGFSTAARVTRFLPSSFAAETVLAGHDERLVRGLLELGAGLVLIVILAWLWTLLLQRVMTSAPATGGAARTSRDNNLPFDVVLKRFRPRVRAVAAKDIILMFREPAQRIGVIIMGVFGAAAVIVPAILLRDYPLAVFIVAGVGLLMGFTCTNLYGYDGSSQWVNVAAGDDARGDLLGKLLARLLVYTPPMAVMAVVLPAIISPRLVVAVVGITLGVWFVSLGLGLVQSVVAPYPVVYSENSLMATNSGSFMAFVAQMVAFPVIAILCGPFVLLAMLNVEHPVWPSVAGVGALLVGGVAMWAMWLGASRYSAGRQPELLGMISKRAEA